MSKTLEVLTHTKRRDYKNCHRYFKHKHMDHLVPRLQRKGRRRGTIFGDTLFALMTAKYEQEADPTLGPWTDMGTQFAIEKNVTEAYEEIRDTGMLDPDALEELELEEIQMRVMVFAYTERYGIDRRREIEFDLPLRNPATNRTSRAFKLGGKIDGVKVIGPNHAAVIEDKVVGQIQRAMIERLPLDDQTSEYADAFHSMGWDATVWYRHTRWPGINPKPAKQFKTKDDYPGETLAEYEQRLAFDVLERQQFYFDEQIIHFPTIHLDDYREGRWQTAQDILRTRRTGHYYMNPSRCWEYGGCEYIPLCTKVEDAINLYTVEADNPELSKEEGAVSEYAGQ